MRALIYDHLIPWKLQNFTLEGFPFLRPDWRQLFLPRNRTSSVKTITFSRTPPHKCPTWVNTSFWTWQIFVENRLNVNHSSANLVIIARWVRSVANLCESVASTHSLGCRVFHDDDPRKRGNITDRAWGSQHHHQTDRRRWWKVKLRAKKKVKHFSGVDTTWTNLWRL